MKLTLKTERLAELTTDDLNRVAGAAQQTVGLKCLSLLGGCQSYQACTTAISCGCQPTWNCA
jgi:hypothetical protein